MEGLIIVFIIATTIFVTLYFLLRLKLNSLIVQLNRINSTNTNSKLLLSSTDKQVQKLTVEINKSLEEKKKTEAEYKRMDMELRQAIANMSHDLRTPLTSIMGYMQLIEDSNLSDYEKSQYIDIVKSRAKSLQILISSFYDLSRLEAKEYKLELKPLKLSNLICDAIASFYNDFLNKGIEPVIEVDDKDAAVNADENAVRRVFSNLLQNMLKYAGKNMTIALEQKGNYIVTIFKNDAANLNDKDVPHLFERFFTADPARNDKSTGLGLAITKQLVEQMGHKISAELANGKLCIIIEWNLTNSI